MCLLEHLVGTTGMDATERRKHEYEDKCVQCGEVLTEKTHVAAHVRVHPLGLFCWPCAFDSLCTTCKKCNHVKSSRPRQFWTFGRKLIRL